MRHWQKKTNMRFGLSNSSCVIAGYQWPPLRWMWQGINEVPPVLFYPSLSVVLGLRLSLWQYFWSVSQHPCVLFWIARFGPSIVQLCKASKIALEGWGDAIWVEFQLWGPPSAVFRTLGLFQTLHGDSGRADLNHQLVDGPSKLVCWHRAQRIIYNIINIFIS